MGKLLNKYMAKYNAAIGKPPAGMMVVKPEVWILGRWEMDNGIDPWKPDYQKKLDEATKQDPEFGKVLSVGMAMMADMMKVMGRKK